MALWIRSAKVLDLRKLSWKDNCDVLIDKGKIVSVGSRLKPTLDNLQEINAKGLWLVPGLIDLNARLCEPGFEEQETLKTAAKAAAFGGFTSVLAMPSTQPVMDSASLVRSFNCEAAKALVNLLPAVSATLGGKGEQLSELGDLISAGAVAIVDEHSRLDALLMRRVMDYAKMFDVPVLGLCKDHALNSGGVLHEGEVSTALGMPGTPSEAESLILARNLALAELTGARYHAQSLSSKESVALLKMYKRKGLDVSAETHANYLCLTNKHIQNYDTNFKLDPPLRTGKDQKALKDALKDETLDVIASGHRPCLREDKDHEFECAPFGAIGLESSLASVLTEFSTKDLDLAARLIAAMSLRPAQILNLPYKGLIEPQMDADMVLIDPQKTWVYDPKDCPSKSCNTPFAGAEFTAKVISTIVSGKVVYRDE